MQGPVHRIPGLELSDMTFRVPLDYGRPNGEQITVFARKASAAGKSSQDMPWLVFFQGGPGFGAPRPEGNSGWLKRLLREFHVLLLDGRGTGRSSPITHQTLARLEGAQAQADYLKHFRADNIVADAEHIRRELLGDGVRWAALGQSFGGFCAVRYLSAAPEGLSLSMITGGLPPLERPVDDIYRATYRRCANRNGRYYARYPGDIELAQEIAAFLEDHDIRLPGGGRLTPRRFQQLGMGFGMSYGFEEVHYLLESAFVDGRDGRELSYSFLRGVENESSFETNPIYALLHEAEYCQGQASHWSAERIRAEYPEFMLQPGRPVYFTGEMVYPWMFEDYANLQPMFEAAQILADCEDWPRLYDVDRLRANTVPCAAAIYHDDMYVEASYSEETAGSIGTLKAWITNEYDHNGLRADGEHIVDRLLGMARGEI